MTPLTINILGAFGLRGADDARRIVRQIREAAAIPPDIVERFAAVAATPVKRPAITVTCTVTRR